MPRLTILIKNIIISKKNSTHKVFSYWRRNCKFTQHRIWLIYGQPTNIE